MDHDKKNEKSAGNIVRRDFIKASGVIYVAAVVGCAKPGPTAPTLTMTVAAANLEYAPSQGYLVVDSKKCQGCLSCMLACSLAHHGSEDLTLSRIQIVQDPFGKFPDDLSIGQCRQCVDPQCVKECPEGAIFIDEEHGNVRRVDEDLCVGCMTCVESCPHLPSRAVWNVADQVSQKCDLCAEVPHWRQGGGGPGGRQACVSVCPVAAIKFQRAVPVQDGDAGYEVNLRGAAWKRMGYADD